MRKKLLCFALLGLAIFNVASAWADERVRIGVARFRSRAEGYTNDQAAAISEALADMLREAKTLDVVDCDRLDSLASQNKLNTSGNIDTWTATEMGKLAGCRYVVVGSVTNVKTKASATSFLFIATASHEADATMDARIIDVTTGDTMTTVSGYGHASEQASAFDIGYYGSITADTSGKEAGAVVAATSMLGFKIREAVTGEYIRVTGTAGKNVNLNAGSKAGVVKGNFYRICVSGAEDKTIAVVKVTDVKENTSTSQVIDGGGKAALIQNGDNASPITAEEAKNLSKRKAILSERPRGKSSDTDIASLGKEVEKKTIQDLTPTKPATATSSGAEKHSSALENKSTDPGKVIATYGLSSGEANTRRISHIGANRLGNKKQAYDKFVELANSYDGDYLAAFRAGEIAQALGDKEGAKTWFEKALAINPNYEPAQKAINKLSSSPAPQRKTKSKKQK